MSYIRNFTFGVEDGLVSTVGLLSGIAIAEVGRETIFLTGAVLVFVEAFSMAVGSLLAEQSAEEYEFQKEISMKKSLLGGVVMFFSYLLSGAIPLLPYLFLPTSTALLCSIGLSLVALLTLGVIDARISHIPVIKNSFRILLLGGIAIAIGISIGRITSTYF